MQKLWKQNLLNKIFKDEVKITANEHGITQKEATDLENGNVGPIMSGRSFHI